jgi:bifunctional UDP-N-acetylglucosamine pyrophosphorylase/glucosamine-1-phosphate N-acetyltransferase
VIEPRAGAVIVLAAGEGTRMRSRTPKVLHPLAGRGLLVHVLRAVAPLGARRRIVVLGHGRDQVERSLAGIVPAVTPVVQERRGGTGHAVRVALAALGSEPPAGPIVVLPADVPLLRPATMVELLAAHHAGGAAATVLTAVVDDPFGYGRVVRGQSGEVLAIVEQRDADAATAAIDEINTGVYVFDSDALVSAIGRLTTDNAQGEEYLTDVVGLLVGDGLDVGAHALDDPDEALGVNDRIQLATAGRVLRDRITRAAMLAGTTIVDPETTWIDADVTLEPDTTLLPGTHLHGNTVVSTGATVGPDCSLTDTFVGSDATISRTTATRAHIGPGSVIGPYTYLRPGTRTGHDVKIGAFVETKAAEIGDEAKVPHLSYVGDAVVGARTNIGCSTVFANYDGVAKHTTIVGSDVKIGSDTVLVAPVTIGDGAYTGAGTVVTEDVPPGALAVREGRQRAIDGWVGRRRPGSAAALAAQRATAGANLDIDADGGVVAASTAASTAEARAGDGRATAGTEPRRSDQGREHLNGGTVGVERTEPPSTSRMSSGTG